MATKPQDLLERRHLADLKLKPVSQKAIAALTQVDAIRGDLLGQPPGPVE
jgi:hypothetical protein